MATILRAADTMMYEAKVTRDSVAVAGRGVIGKRSKDNSRQRFATHGLGDAGRAQLWTLADFLRMTSNLVRDVPTRFRDGVRA